MGIRSVRESGKPFPRYWLQTPAHASQRTIEPRRYVLSDRGGKNVCWHVPLYRSFPRTSVVWITNAQRVGFLGHT